MENKLLALLKSRKFWAAFIGLALVVVKAIKPDLAISEDDLMKLVVLLSSFILGTGLEDSRAKS